MTGSPGSGRRLAALLILEALALWVANLPTWLDFPAFAFGDLGASLTTQDLVERGLRPGPDFAHHYGLLPIALGRVWFGLLGRSPLSYYAAMGGLGAWMAWNLARVAEATRAGRSGSALLAVGLPFSIQSSYPNLAHGLEAGLLCHALAEQARGRRSLALALSTVAVLAKPSLGIPYGLVLVVATLAPLRRRWSWRSAFGRDGLGPALGVGGVLVALLSLRYGLDSVWRTVLPSTGLATYRAGGFGFFFGSGRAFWAPPGAGLGYYLGTVVGYWLVGSLTLAAAAEAAIARGFRGPADEFLATCAAVHVAFVFAMFGHANTWVYDSFILGMGLAALPTLGRGWRAWTWVLVGLAALGLRSTLLTPVEPWRRHVRGPETAGLWAHPADRAEWAEVRSRLEGRRAAVLSTSGCAPLLFPDLLPAQGVFLVPGMEGEPDVPRKAAQLAGATRIVLPKYLGNERLAEWPAFAGILKGCRVAFDGKYYRIYEKD